MTKLTIALIVFCGLAHAEGRIKLMTNDEAMQFEQRLRGWAQTYYPGLVAEAKLPEGIVLGFIVDKSGAVIAHTAGFGAADGTTIAHHLAHLFPRFEERQLEANGGACFGMRQNEPRYCVEYATLAE